MAQLQCHFTDWNYLNTNVSDFILLYINAKTAYFLYFLSILVVKFNHAFLQENHTWIHQYLMDPSGLDGLMGNGDL